MANFMEDKLRYFGTASFEILPHLKEDHFAYWAGESSPRESLHNVEEYRPETAGNLCHNSSPARRAMPQTNAEAIQISHTDKQPRCC
jgi:hypothetical protein